VVVGVLVGVGVLVEVLLAVIDGVFVGVDVLVGVRVEVFVGVLVGVLVGVGVLVAVLVGVTDGVTVLLGVIDCVGVGVAEGNGQEPKVTTDPFPLISVTKTAHLWIDSPVPTLTVEESPSQLVNTNELPLFPPFN
jgi:hypothetical protein